MIFVLHLDSKLQKDMDIFLIFFVKIIFPNLYIQSMAQIQNLHIHGNKYYTQLHLSEIVKC